MWMTYSGTRDIWKWADYFFLWVPWLFVPLLWAVFGFWYAVIFIPIWSGLWMNIHSEIEKKRKEPLSGLLCDGVSENGNYVWRSHAECTKCGYEKINVVKYYRCNDYCHTIDGFETHCPRCGNNDVFSLDLEFHIHHKKSV